MPSSYNNKNKSISSSSGESGYTDSLDLESHTSSDNSVDRSGSSSISNHNQDGGMDIQDKKQSF